MSLSPSSDVPGLSDRRWLSRLFYGLLWFISISLLSIAALRIVYHDGTLLLIWFNAFTRYIYLPAYGILAIAVWKRRWWLAIAGTSIICLHIAWIAPDYIPDRRFSRPENEVTDDAGAPRFRILFANVNALNPNHELFTRELQDAHPDIAVLAEFHGPWLVAFAKTPLFTRYPYGKELRRAQLGWINVYSRIPLQSTRQVFAADRVVQILDVRVGMQTLHIIGLHAPRPMNLSHFDYDGFWNQVIPVLLAEKGPVVIVGDFNATQYSRVYKQLTAHRFRSAHADVGRGFATTWPNGHYWLPPIRIDQVLLSPEVECLDIREGEGLGSDHKPLVVDVRIRSER